MFLDFVTPMHFDRLTVRDSKKRASSRVSEMKPMSVARIGARANRSTLDDSRARRTVTARECTPWTLAVEESRANPRGRSSPVVWVLTPVVWVLRSNSSLPLSVGNRNVRTRREDGSERATVSYAREGLRVSSSAVLSSGKRA